MQYRAKPLEARQVLKSKQKWKRLKIFKASSTICTHKTSQANRWMIVFIVPLQPHDSITQKQYKKVHWRASVSLHRGTRTGGTHTHQTSHARTHWFTVRSSLESVSWLSTPYRRDTEAQSWRGPSSHTWWWRRGRAMEQNKEKKHKDFKGKKGK